MIQPIGYVKLHRELASKPIWLKSTAEQKVILITLLMMANFKSNQWEWSGEKFEVLPGQFVTSLDSIAKECGTGISIQNVRTALARFEKLDFLTNESTKNGRLITIANWTLYQDTNKEPNIVDNKDLTKTSQRPNKDLTPKEESNNVNNDKKEKKRSVDYEDIFNHYILSGLIKHTRLTEEMKKGIDLAVKTLGCDAEEMKRMIDRHKEKSIAMKDNDKFKIRSLAEFFGQKKFQSVALICSDYSDDVYGSVKQNTDSGVSRLIKPEMTLEERMLALSMEDR